MNLEAASKRNIEFRGALHSAFLLALAASYISSCLFKNPGFNLVMEITAAITLIESLTLTRGVPRNISLVLLGMGSVFLSFSDAGPVAWLSGFGQNAGLITLFVLVPQLAIPLRCEHYTSALAEFYRTYVNSKGRLCLYSMLLTHFLGVILNVGAVAVVYNLVKDNIRSDNERLVLNAINRGFATSIMWSPYFAAMALVLGKMQVAWSSIVILSLPLSMIALTGGFLMDSRQWVSRSPAQVKSDFRSGSRAVLLKMFFAGAGITLAMLALEWLTGLNMVLIVCIVSVLFPLLWSFFPEHKEVYRSGLTNYFKVNIPVLSKEVVLFLSAGFFASAVSCSGFGRYILTFAQAMAGHGYLVVQLTTLFTVVVLAIIGLHPVVSVSVLATSLAPPAGGLPAEYLAATFLVSWAIANISSPFTAVSMMLARFSGRNAVEVSLQWNIWYVVIIGLVLCIILTLFNMSN